MESENRGRRGNYTPHKGERFKRVLTDEQMSVILGDIPEGMSIASLAKSVGVSRQLAHHYRKKEGLASPERIAKELPIKLSRKSTLYLEQFENKRKAIDAILTYLYDQQHKQEKSNQ